MASTPDLFIPVILSLVCSVKRSPMEREVVDISATTRCEQRLLVVML